MAKAVSLRLFSGLNSWIDLAGRQLGEGRIGRCEHCERSWAREGIDELGGFDEGGKDGQTLSGNGGFPQWRFRRSSSR